MAHNPPVADRYIVGSDQVWNTFYETGRDGAFYLDFVQSGDRISYAASFSHVEIDDIWKNFIKEKLLKFKAVSVREYHGLKILESMGIKGSWVLDPVFLLCMHFQVIEAFLHFLDELPDIFLVDKH